MVLASRPLLRFQLPRIDSKRALALATAISVNLLALMLLSLPQQMPTPRPLMNSQPVVIPVDFIRPRPPEPVPAMPVAPPRPALRPQPTPRAPAPPVVVESSAVPVLEAPPPTLDTTTVALGNAESDGLIEREAQPAYDDAPPPRYPAIALQRGWEGTVLLAVLVAEDGRVQEVRVHQSSGHRLLDQQAARHVLERWRFQPAVRAGQPVASWASVPLQFRITD